jgi:TonB family protein
MRSSWFVLLIGFAALPGAWAQNTSTIFLPPIAGAPFSGVIVVERTTIPVKGAPFNLKTVREVARDSQGRIYNVFRRLVPASYSGEPPIIRVHFYDPQTRSYAYIYPQQKTYMTGTVNHPPAAEPADLIASPAGSSVPLNQFTKQQDLGTRSIEGISAHGVRETQTIPAGNSGSGSEIVLTDEYWYSDDLHMNVKIEHDDPRTGNVTMTMTKVTRTEPDPALFQIPEGYQNGFPSMSRGIESGPAKRPPPSETASPVYHVGGNVSAPRLVSAPDPEFPAGVQQGGVVVVSCIVSEQGLPTQVRVIRSPSDAFDQNAIRAVQQYRFEPAMQNSDSAAKPVSVQVNIEVNFRPPA